jgi:hypothetical protein
VPDHVAWLHKIHFEILAHHLPILYIEIESRTNEKEPGCIWDSWLQFRVLADGSGLIYLGG